MGNVRLMKPYIGFDEVEADFREVFDSGIFTRGKHVEAFRHEICAYTGAAHCFLTTSATTALWISLKLLGISSDDEVIVSDFSFPATANVVEDLGAVPVFADVDPYTFNMLSSELEQKISPRTKAVIFVDALGNPTGISEIKRICEQRGIPLIEDAACAIGSGESGRKCGSIADITCFSFHPRKLISAGEGGAITTNRDDWAQWLDIKLAHGANGMKGMALDFVDFGYNFRLSELQAIMGRKQLASIDEIIEGRNQIAESYIKSLRPMGFIPQCVGDGARHNYQSIVFLVPELCDRDALILALREAGIESTIGTYALSNCSYYANKYNALQSNSLCLERQTITLPCFEGLEVKLVVDAIQRVLS